eukprot:CAMPEP_0172777806 /NCGR_PEP_ID=MMETSP1074-20121228/201586_1 /TAXON_ID=2916 /ORGANISM="Ceratium fusus, Strain PA161109" /LENGTH=333 /DNA_ID=CAMNT_0013614735 /DNA_START=811 /DNA_END=1808 /DNA_ORIENTATION=-
MNIALNNFSLGYVSIAVNLIIRSCLPLTTFLSQQTLSLFKLYPEKPCNKLEITLMVCGVLCAGAFTALNNFSLGYVSIAVNLIIRSCLPLTTFLSQQTLALFKLYPGKPCNKLEIFLMVCGVLCAGAFTTAKIMGSSASHHSGSNQMLGVVMCICSLLCGSLNLALAGVLGEMKLSVYDTVAYMSMPAFMFLIPFCLIPKPVPGAWPKIFGFSRASDFDILRTVAQKPVPGAWPKIFGFSRASDFDILRTVAQISPKTFWLFALSGIFSFAYNVIQFSIVHTLSPSATAFGGNFNKAALVFLTLILPFLQVHKLPGSPYIYWIWAAVLGNVAA